MNLTDPILRHARMQPHAVALIENERKITYRELADLTLRTAGHLRALGVKQGDEVGLCLRDDSRHVIALLAVARLGAVAVQIDWRSRPADKARVANAFALKLLLLATESDFASNAPAVLLDAGWDRSVAAADSPADAPSDSHAPMVVAASSGTTGMPKFTLATHNHLYLHAAACLEIVPPSRRQTYLSTLPLYFSAGRMLCLAHLIRGDTVILFSPLFTAAEFLRFSSRNGATAGFVVPSVVRQLLAIAEPGKPLLPDMDVLICGGAPLFPDEKMEALRSISPHFHEMYGAAAIGAISALRPEEMAEHAASVGRPSLLVEIEVVDDDDQPLGPGETGRLRCRGPGLESPLPDRADSRPAQDFRDGWHYPGELASLDELGYICLQGRASEVIFRGGAKIFPAEIESVLQAHDAVAEAAVVGQTSSGNEQKLIAFVVTNGTVTGAELLAHCRTVLTAYKVPQQIHILSELPRNSSGKLDKLALKNRLTAPTANTP